MDLAALREAISAAGIREDAYALLADRDERLCLTHNHPYWAVFYSERGNQTGERHFDTEAEACEAFLALLLKDESNRIRNPN